MLGSLPPPPAPALPCAWAQVATAGCVEGLTASQSMSPLTTGCHAGQAWLPLAPYDLRFVGQAWLSNRPHSWPNDDQEQVGQWLNGGNMGVLITSIQLPGTELTSSEGLHWFPAAPLSLPAPANSGTLAAEQGPALGPGAKDRSAHCEHACRPLLLE